MKARTYIALIVAAALLSVPAFAQSAAELLQKGIYAQETAGDLDGAIKIFRQIAGSSDTRPYIAQALYRLGLCLLTKGDSAGAAEAFRRVIREYPDQKDMVAKAEQHLPRHAMLPAPWAEREWAEYNLNHNNQLAGLLVLSVDPARNNKQHQMLHMRNFAGPGSLDFEVDRATLRPIVTTGADYTARFEDTAVLWTPKGGTERRISTEPGTFDASYVFFLLRRLPLAAGYSVTLPLVVPGTMTITTNISVSAIEDIQVPAGKFHCFKVEALGATYWISTEAPRVMARMIQGPIEFQLSRLGNNGPSEHKYRDAAVGFSFVAPAEWAVQTSAPDTKDNSTRADLMPLANTLPAISVWGQKERLDDIAAHLASRPAFKAKQRAAEGTKDWKIRPGSIRNHKVAGQDALSAIADYTENGNPRVEVMTWICTREARTVTYAALEPAKLDAFLPRFQAFVETVRLP